MILAEATAAAVDAIALAKANQAGLIALGKGLGAGFAAISVGFTGLKAAEGVSRNPAASGKILVQGLLGMALAEGLGFAIIFGITA